MLGERLRIEEPVSLDRGPVGGERAELEDYLLELVESGDRMSAIKLVRVRYGYGLTEARRFVDELAGVDKPADPSL